MIFNYNSGVYSFKVEQFLPITIDEAWDFFSNPKNLESITPNDLSFRITSEHSNEMYNGQIVTYKIGIIPFFKSNWVTEIKGVEKYKCFIDTQLHGPYKLWHHYHRFVPAENGTLISDEIHFKIPFSLVQRLVFNLFIKRKLTKIFSFRTKTLQQHFK